MKHIVASSFCLMLILAATGRAEETDRIMQLTAEQAKRLAQDKSGRLALAGVNSLSPEAAQELAQYEGWLYLNGLATLSKETADALGQHKGPLHLDGLKSISDDSARSLARHNGELSLGGLLSISDETAEALAQHRGGRLYLHAMKLDSIKEGNGTVLDNTLIVYMSDSGEDHHGSCEIWPTVLVGTLGGRLKTAGRHLQFPKYKGAGHRTITNFYLSLLRAVGDQREQFGDSDPELADIDTSGPLAEILA
jgi:hypothetical protein